MEKIDFTDALGYSLIGIGIVFAVLFVLTAVILIMSALLRNSGNDKETKQPTLSAPSSRVSGSRGEVCTFDVPDRTAAMIMAIVADNLQTPLEQLKFVSIKEVGREEDDEI